MKKFLLFSLLVFVPHFAFAASIYAWTDQAGSHLGSVSWTDITSSADGTHLAATELVANSGIGCSGDGGIYTSTDIGVTWTLRVFPASSCTWWAIASSADGTKVFAILGPPNMIWASAYISFSTDGGATWADEMGGGSRLWVGVTSSADGTKLAAASVGGSSGTSPGYISTSVNSGVTWTVQTGPGPHLWKAVAYSADGSRLVAVAVGNTATVGGIFTSTDGGVTWTDETAAGSLQWSGITSSSNGTHLAATVLNGDIYTSTDGGATWTDRTAAGSRAWGAITSSADGSHIAAVAGNTTTAGDIFTSTDGGATWTDETAAGSRLWSGITSSSDGTKLAATAYGGDIWTASAGPTSPVITGPTSIAAGSSGTYSFVSTEAGGSLRYGIDWNDDGTIDEWAPAIVPPYSASGVATSTTHTFNAVGTQRFQVLAQDSSGSDSGWTSYTVTVTQPAPTVLLTASPTSISTGQSSTLTWSSSNATQCTATNFTMNGTSQTRTVIYLTSGTSWTVPSDWNSSNNTIEVIGGGGSGAGGIFASGGGGGAYSSISNLALTPGTLIKYMIGAGGAGVNTTTVGAHVNGNAGSDTYFNGTGSACGSQSVCAKGGSGASMSGGSSGGSSAGGIGTTKYSGGSGGSFSSCNNSDGGGGGAAGPNGNGWGGGNGGCGGGGGGGGGADAGRGSNGDDGHGGGAGGNGGAGPTGTPGGVGSGSSGAGVGSNGSGGGGSSGGNAGAGGYGTEWDTSHGSGGGGGGTVYGMGGNAGLYGGGGGATSDSTGNFSGSGAPGLIVVTYTPATSGSATVTPSQTTTYTVTCTGAGGTGSDSATVTYQCTPTYTCTDDTTVHNSCPAPSGTDTTCSSGYVCSPGSPSCIAPQRPQFVGFQTTGANSFGATGHIQFNPALVHSDTSSYVYWKIDNVSSCSIIGYGVDWTGASAGCDPDTGECFSGSAGKETPAITHQTTYTLSCTGLDGSSLPAETATVGVPPTFQEK